MQERDLLDLAAEAVRPLGVDIRLLKREAPLRDVRADGLVEVRFGGQRRRYALELKRGLRPATIGAVIHQAKALPDKPLLVADYITPALADELRVQGLEFLDTAGNAYLNHPPLLVFVKGQRPLQRPTDPVPGRTFQPTGLQVLFALLAQPELVARPYREIAKAAGVAHGAVGWVMAELPHLGHLATVQGRRRLTNAERLLDRWTEAYARTLRPKLLLGRFHGDLADLVRRVGDTGALVGGEVAAAELTRHLKPVTATLYAPDLDPRLMAKLRLRAADDGEVDIRRRFWTFGGEHPGLAPALLVYADLLAIGDARCLETAELMRGDIVLRLV